MKKACLIDRAKFVDDRGHFENIPVTTTVEQSKQVIKFYGKRTYICDNFQKGTVRGYHYHKYEQKIFICLRGAVKFILLPGDMMQTVNPVAWKPEVFVLSAEMGKALFIPAHYANAWQSLSDDTILLGVSDRTVDQSRDDDIRMDPALHHPEYWETKWR